MNSKFLITSILSISAMVFIPSCTEKRTTEVSLKSDFTAAAKGSTTAEVPDDVEKLRFTMNVELYEGIFTYILVSPSDDTIKNEIFTGYGNHKLNELLTLEPGIWKMAYTISNNEDLTPEGSFKLTLSY
jgi:hypothetical protein